MRGPLKYIFKKSKFIAWEVLDNIFLKIDFGGPLEYILKK